MRPSRSTSVPKAIQPTYDAIVALTDAFCRDHLNEEYRDLARAMTAALCRKRPSPLNAGKPGTWACGIIYLLAQLNFLPDKATQPYMAMTEVRAAFGVGESTAGAKAKMIANALDAHRFDPAWMLRSLADRSPLMWMVQVNGFLVDLRDMPRDVQVVAHARGMVPYVPADRKVAR